MYSRYKTPLWHKVAYWLFVIISLAISLELLRRNLPRYLPKDWAAAHELDVLADWKAARLFRLGVNPYTSVGLSMLGMQQVGWPPTTGFWFLPMTDFPKALVAEFMSLTALILLVPHVYLTAKTLKWPAPLCVSILILALVSATIWSRYHFDMIQVSEHIAFLYLVAWLCLRRGMDVRAGVCIGAAMTLKLFPGVMFIMLLFARRWRGAIAAGVTYWTVAVIMTMRYGIRAWQLFLEQEKPITEGWLGSLQNASLSGLVTQSLFPFCETDPHPSKTGSIIISLVSVVLLLSAAWVTRANLKRYNEVDKSAIDLPFALFSLLSVFLNPFAWEHYYMLSLQPILVVLTMLWCTLRTVCRRWADDECSTGLLASTGLIALSAVPAFAFVIRALARDHWAVFTYRDLWRKTGIPLFHWQGHYFEVLNFAPWLIGLFYAFLITAYRNRLRIS